GLLPEYKAVIFDEAHTLEDVAADHLGLQVTRGSLDYLLNKLYNPRGRKGLLAFFGDEDAVAQVENARRAGEQFFNAVLAWVAKQPRPQRGAAPAQNSNTVRVREPNVVADVLSEELKKLATQVDAVAKDLDDEQKIEFTALSNRCRGLQLALAQWLAQELPGQVYWVETTTGGTRAQRIGLLSAP